MKQNQDNFLPEVLPFRKVNLFCILVLQAWQNVVHYRGLVLQVGQNVINVGSLVLQVWQNNVYFHRLLRQAWQNKVHVRRLVLQERQNVVNVCILILPVWQNEVHFWANKNEEFRFLKVWWKTDFDILTKKGQKRPSRQ